MRPYQELADVYDLLHRSKPYAREARQVRALARRYARRPLRSLLDVACGSGRHLEEFDRWFSVSGLDASPAMLARARRRVPSAALHRGRMESFQWGRTFDLVVSLFSSIGYARTRNGLRRTVQNLARHTAPGGVVVVEPWITPSQYRGGSVHTVLAEGPGLKVARMNGSDRRGDRSIFDFHHLVGRNGSVRHLVERHDLGMFDRPTMLAAFRGAGLRPRYLARGLSSGRGIYVAVRPLAGRPGGGGPVRAGRRRRRAGS